MKTLRFFFLGLLAALSAAGEPARVPLFEGLGDHHRPITTTSKEAQRYFDQGLTWTHAFNHDEAIRSFEEAARLDPRCAMAYWGIAYCHGPHINNPAVPPERAKLAWDALGKALACKDGASPVERALIDALAKRYADPQPEDRTPLDAAYAAAMREVWLANRKDADIGHLYAEALMDLQPWDLWDKEGKPKGKAMEIVAVLEETLAHAPNHAGANHLYIHTVEASPFPEKGIPSADRLRTLVPGSGHLVHMPAHIDVQTGQWKKAAEANEAAIEADRRYRAISPKQGFYRLYMIHNDHFLAFACMMQGRSADALAAARGMIASIPADFVKENPAFVDPYMPIVIETLMRFGRWDDVLAQPRPDASLPITVAKWTFARAAALGAKGRLKEARAEQVAFREARKRVPEDAMMAINKAHAVLAVADAMLEGELCYREGRIDEAVASLREGVALEDELMYMEPPEWIQPVRHTLGAVLLEAGRLEEAEAVYRKDLEVWPENGWSLFGLAKTLAKRGDADAAAAVKRRFQAIWADADVAIEATCLCVESHD